MKKNTRVVIIPKTESIEDSITSNPQVEIINKVRHDNGFPPLDKTIENEIWKDLKVKSAKEPILDDSFKNRTESVDSNMTNNYVEDIKIVDRRELSLRKRVGLFTFIGILIAPIIFYILICTLQEISTFNLESITGGFFRVISGIMAYMSMEILIVVLILRLFFKVLLVRLRPDIFSEELQYDFLHEYLSLESWQRIKVDLSILFFLLLLVLVNAIVLLTRIPLVS